MLSVISTPRYVVVAFLKQRLQSTVRFFFFHVLGWFFDVIPPSLRAFVVAPAPPLPLPIEIISRAHPAVDVGEAEGYP